MAHVRPIAASRVGVSDFEVFNEGFHRGQIFRIHGGLEAAVDAVDLGLAVEDAAVGAAELRLVKSVSEPLGGLDDIFVDFRLDFGNVVLDEDVGAVALLAVFVVNERVVERVHMTGGFPGGRVHEDAGVDAHDVLVHAHHGGPPVLLDVVLQFGAELAVVVSRGEPVVDLA